MTQLLPVLMMRHRRVPRSRWKDHQTPAGKHWIDVVRVSNMYIGLPTRSTLMRSHGSQVIIRVDLDRLA